LFLACDMPFVSPDLLRKMMKTFAGNPRPLFARAGRDAGFPFILSRSALPVLEKQISERQFSLQGLASVLRARRMPLSRNRTFELLNINTPRELASARRAWRRRNPPGVRRRKNGRKTGL